MSDYSERGAQPVEDAAVEDPPTVEEVKAAQRRNHPEQAATARHGDPTEPEGPQETSGTETEHPEPGSD
jgi:hypothetical protein